MYSSGGDSSVRGILFGTLDLVSNGLAVHNVDELTRHVSPDQFVPYRLCRVNVASVET